MMFKGIKNFFASADKPTLLFAIASAWPVIGFLPSLPGIVSYVIPIIYATYCLTKMRGMDGWFFVLLLYIPLELILARPNSVFHPWQRYVLFAILLLNVSPFLQGNILRAQRKQIFQLMMWTCVIIGVGSFFAKFLGINYMNYYYAENINRAGTFGGLTKQSMLLGPIAGIAACYLVSRAIKTKRLFDWVWVIFALGSVLFSASRSSILATIAGVFMTAFRQSESINRFFRVLILAIIIGAATVSVWDSALLGIAEKTGDSEIISFDSREELWEERIDDFKSSPLVGVGFCATLLRGTYGVDLQTGRIETGSSWIIIFSMLGILGAFIIIPILFRAFTKSYRNRDSLSPLVCGILTLFFIHMFAEGYIFAGGSFLAFMLWLTIGVALDSQYLKE